MDAAALGGVLVGIGGIASGIGLWLKARNGQVSILINGYRAIFEEYKGEAQKQLAALADCNTERQAQRRVILDLEAEVRSLRGRVEELEHANGR